MAETVITTPLLVPPADGAPASSRLSRQGAQLEPQRPYSRFRLVSRCIPPNLPLCLEQHNISPEIWGQFWTRIKALVLDVEQHEKLSMFVYIIAFACVVCLGWAAAASEDDEGMTPRFRLNGTEVLELTTADEPAFDTALLVSVVIPILVALLAGRLYLSRKRSLQEAIELFCKDGEEANMFHATGYGLECELLPSEVNGSRLHLYILPMDRPYTRFEVYNGMLTFPGWNSSYLSPLVLHSNMECIPLDDWNSFSSAIAALYEPQRQLASFAAKGCIVMLLLLPFVGPALKMGDDGVVLLLLIAGFFALLFCTCIYFVYRYYRFLGAKLTLVHELAMRLAPHGAYVEHRRVMKLYAWHGPYERHYVYLFPAIVRDRSSTHDADDTLSTESIRNRQSLSA
jgi:hypothetical protein